MCRNFRNNCIPIIPSGVSSNSNIRLISAKEVWSLVKEERDGGKYWKFLNNFLGNQFEFSESVRSLLREIFAASDLPNRERVVEALKMAGWTERDVAGERVPAMFFEAGFWEPGGNRIIGNIDIATYGQHEVIQKALQNLFTNYSEGRVWIEITLPFPPSAFVCSPVPPVPVAEHYFIDLVRDR